MTNQPNTPKRSMGTWPLVIAIAGVLLLIASMYILVDRGVPVALGEVPTAETTFAPRPTLVPPTRDTSVLPTTPPIVVAGAPTATPMAGAQAGAADLAALNNLFGNTAQQPVSPSDFGLTDADWAILSDFVVNSFIVSPHEFEFEHTTSIVWNGTPVDLLVLNGSGFNGVGAMQMDQIRYQMVSSGQINNPTIDASGAITNIQNIPIGVEVRFVNNAMYIKADSPNQANGTSGWVFFTLDDALAQAGLDDVFAGMGGMGGLGGGMPDLSGLGIDPAMLGGVGMPDVSGLGIDPNLLPPEVMDMLPANPLNQLLGSVGNLQIAQYLPVRREMDTVIRGVDVAHFYANFDVDGFLTSPDVQSILSTVALLTGTPTPDLSILGQVNIGAEFDIYITPDDKLLRELGIVFNVGTQPNVQPVFQFTMRHNVQILNYTDAYNVEVPPGAVQIELN